jgi:hypothetical protein
VAEFKTNYGLQDLNRLVEDAPELDSFRIEKFRLSLIRELSKFFVADFASKVEFSLQIVHVLRRHRERVPELVELMEMALGQLWQRFPRVQELLFAYYDEWLDIKRDIKAWKEKQQRREREEEP